MISFEKFYFGVTRHSKDAEIYTAGETHPPLAKWNDAPGYPAASVGLSIYCVVIWNSGQTFIATYLHQGDFIALVGSLY